MSAAFTHSDVRIISNELSIDALYEVGVMLPLALVFLRDLPFTKLPSFLEIGKVPDRNSLAPCNRGASMFETILCLTVLMAD